MKLRIFLFAAAFLACSFAMAQNEGDKVVEEFNPHWFLQAQGGAAYTVGEVSFSELLSPAAQLGVGYHFSPVWSARFAVNGWQAKGSWVNPATVYKYNYVGGNLDVFANLCNAFGGFKPYRKFNVSLFAGVGIDYAFNNKEANDFHTKSSYTPEYLWQNYWVTAVGRFGADFEYAITPRVGINLEVNANILDDHFNSKKAVDHNVDWQCNALLGLKFRLGDPVKKTIIPAPVVPVEPAPAPVVEKKPVAPAPAPVIEDLRKDIFFEIRSSVLSVESIQKLNEVVAYMNQYPKAKVNVTAYADVKTGNPRINMGYSAARAKSVVKYLVDRGVAESRIIHEHFGDTVQPFPNNDDNRAAICIATTK